LTNDAITHQLHLHRETARTWRNRRAEAADCLEAAEAEGATDPQLLRLIEAILADEPRALASRLPLLALSVFS
jgi:hypothetical protein